MADDRAPTNAETERRFVRSEDPELTPEANRLLTDELREVVGRDEVEVPRGTPRRAQETHATHSPLVATEASRRSSAARTTSGRPRRRTTPPATCSSSAPR